MPEEVFVEPKSTNWPRIILVAVLGLGLLTAAAYAGYWYGTQEISKLKDQISNLQLKTQIPETQSAEPTIPSATDPTASWETYTNTHPIRQYTFKYPLGWGVV